MNYYGGYGSNYGGYGGYGRYGGGFDLDAGSLSGMESTALGFAFTFIAILYLVLLAYVITNYVIRALGLYRIAKNNGVENAWLAWIPLADLYLLGKVTGDISLGNRKLKNTALWLLLVPIIGGGISVLFYFGMILAIVVAGIGASAAGSGTGVIVMPIVVCILMFIAFLVVVVVAALFYYIVYGMAYYTLCAKFKGSAHSVFYTLMALFVPLADAIIMLKLSKMAPVVPPVASPYNYETFNNDTMNMGE